MPKTLHIRYHDRDSQIAPTIIDQNWTVHFTQELTKISIFLNNRDTGIAPITIDRNSTVHFT